jgi:hypothetical protein
MMRTTSRGVPPELADARSFQEAAERLAGWVRELTGCEAVLLRFREDDAETGNWIPALVEQGFGCGFLREEVLIGEEECFCGQVCRGCGELDSPLFTAGGSFLCGNVQKVGENPGVDAVENVRGRCIVEGFESLLIAPLLEDGSPFGCLHLADRRPGVFEPYVEEIEAVCRDCASSLVRFPAESRHISVIKAIETALAPPDVPAVTGLDIAVFYTSATEAAHLGGDFYDVIPLDGGEVFLVVGDYSGRGIGSAGMAARARHAIATAAIAGRSPQDVLTQAQAHLERTLPSGKFVTAVACRYLPDGTLEVATAGHPFPLVLGPDGEARELSLPPNPPLGFADRPYVGSTARLYPGDTLLLYTDGISESQCEGRLFGVEGIADHWQRVGEGSVAALTAGLCRVSAEFHEQSRMQDDRLAMAVRVRSKSPHNDER